MNLTNSYWLFAVTKATLSTRSTIVHMTLAAYDTREPHHREVQTGLSGQSARRGRIGAAMVRARTGRQLDAVVWRLCRAAAAAPPRYCGTRPPAPPRATATHPPTARAPHPFRATARTHAAFLRSARPQARLRPAQRA